jgi:microcystin-dependent protein
VTATEVVGIDQGSIVEIYNDGANVRFVNLGKVGELEFWGGISAIPAWVAACTVRPYLYNDGTVYNFSDYPWLGAKYLGQFGGNGVTTFGVQDLRGRLPLAYDGTGTRITTAGCGVNGAVMGAAGGAQGVGLTVAQLASHYHVAGIYDPSHTHSHNLPANGGSSTGGGGFPVTGTYAGTINASATGVRVNSSNGLDTTYSQGSDQAHPNVQPVQVCGIWVTKT